MSDLVAIVYRSEAKAEEVRQRLLELQREYLITIRDAVIAVKTDNDSVKLNQMVFLSNFRFSSKLETRQRGRVQGDPRTQFFVTGRNFLTGGS